MSLFPRLDAQTKMVLQQDLARTLAEEKKTRAVHHPRPGEAVALSDRSSS
jgi:NitT/TauT family transport system ATP-binding protein